MTELLVDSEAEGARLDVWLARASGRGRTDVQKLIAAGQVSVDGAPASKSLKVSAGQRVELVEPAAEVREAPPSIEVVFEDDDLAVVNKPPGLVVHSAGGSRAVTLVEALRGQMALAPGAGEDRPGIVHRLDKGTSGLMLIAKTGRAYDALAAAMRGRRIVKTYLTLVHGEFTVPSGRIEAPVGRSAKNPASMTVTPRGRASVTEFEVLEGFHEASYLRVGLLTGRTHQIRVHLAHIRHPVVGDHRYGGGAEQMADRLGLTRPFLHAAELRLAHPVSGAELHLEQALPEDLEEALRRARLG